jgi:hypothetical protein
MQHILNDEEFDLYIGLKKNFDKSAVSDKGFVFWELFAYIALSLFWLAVGILLEHNGFF